MLERRAGGQPAERGRPTRPPARADPCHRVARSARHARRSAVLAGTRPAHRPGRPIQVRCTRSIRPVGQLDRQLGGLRAAQHPVDVRRQPTGRSLVYVRRRSSSGRVAGSNSASRTRAGHARPPRTAGGCASLAPHHAGYPDHDDGLARELALPPVCVQLATRHAARSPDSRGRRVASPVDGDAPALAAGPDRSDRRLDAGRAYVGCASRACWPGRRHVLPAGSSAASAARTDLREHREIAECVRAEPRPGAVVRSRLRRSRSRFLRQFVVGYALPRCSPAVQLEPESSTSTSSSWPHRPLRGGHRRDDADRTGRGSSGRRLVLVPAPHRPHTDASPAPARRTASLSALQRRRARWAERSRSGERRRKPRPTASAQRRAPPSRLDPAHRADPNRPRQVLVGLAARVQGTDHIHAVDDTAERGEALSVGVAARRRNRARAGRRCRRRTRWSRCPAARAPSRRCRRRGAAPSAASSRARSAAAAAACRRAGSFPIARLRSCAACRPPGWRA